MTPEEYQTAVAELTRIDTELAALNQQMIEQINAAADLNASVKNIRSKVTRIQQASQPLRNQVEQAAMEFKRQQAEKAKAEAEENTRKSMEAAKQAEQAKNDEFDARVAAAVQKALEAAKG